jgi:hypothetical protein
VSPAAAGSLVTVERRVLGGWTPVAQATLAGDGTFRASFPVSEGAYRAEVVPPFGSGLATAYSPTLTVVYR